MPKSHTVLNDVSMKNLSSIKVVNQEHDKKREQGKLAPDQTVKLTDQRPSYAYSLAASIEKNQIHISRLLLTTLYVVHVLYPPAKPYTDKFIHLQYQIPPSEYNEHAGRTGASKSTPLDSPLYDIGKDDIYYVVFWVVTLTFLRSAIMLYIFTPIAIKICKIHSRKAVTRFAEQGWQNFYYICLFSLGVYLYVGSPYWIMNLDHLYLGWPHYQLVPLFKKYYLISIAFWVHQMVVLNLEERRKDHWQMFSHHVITFFLVVGSYYYYFVRVGHSILMIMDSVDIILITAKMLKYLGFSKVCDILFILFLISWIILRHGVYNVLFYHASLNAGPLMKEMECFPGNDLKRCWSPNIIRVFLLLLGGLQIITCIWMYFILKVAVKVVTGKAAEDVRSDEDDTDEELEVVEEVEAEYEEEEEDDNDDIDEKEEEE